VLLRSDEDGDGFEILLTRRPPEMRFLGGFYVFPGGAVHKDDYSAKALERCRGLSAKDAQTILGQRHEPELALGHWIAGIRELFEEVGVLLCESKSGGAIEMLDEMTKAKFESQRQAIVRGKLGFGEFLESEELWCDLSRVIYFFHRVTPEFYPIRFDTRFYLAPLPVHQTPLPRSEEVTHSLWIKPAEALLEVYHNDFPILPPTTTVLESLAEINSWNELCSRFGISK
jgi:8-oxo-dGTP pyrophosphatase MutT (NUDIX family)